MIAPFQGLVRAIAMLDSELDLGRLNLSDVNIELSVRQSLLRFARRGGTRVHGGRSRSREALPDGSLGESRDQRAGRDRLSHRTATRILRGPEPLPLRKPLSSWAPRRRQRGRRGDRRRRSRSRSRCDSLWPSCPTYAAQLSIWSDCSEMGSPQRCSPRRRTRRSASARRCSVGRCSPIPRSARSTMRASVRACSVIPTTGGATTRATTIARWWTRAGHARANRSRFWRKLSCERSVRRIRRLALETGLSESFAREVGFPAGSAQQWNAQLSALVRALDDDVLIPLRSLYACSGTGGFNNYADSVRSEMKEFVARVGRAVVEGDLDAWRSSHPASVQQLECLGTPENVERWLTSTTRESEGPSGARFTTREAAGNELFWATKVGGPSHAFDTMPHCILSLLGNARTKAIVLDDSRWHEHAARAYLRLFPTPDGRRVLYLEQAQIDFPYKYDSTKCDWNVRDLIDRRIVEHAIEKAKQIGASLVMTDAYGGVAGSFGAFRDSVELVLHPSAAVIEASDTLGPHDWPQGFTQTVTPRSSLYLLPAAKIAAL